MLAHLMSITAQSGHPNSRHRNRVGRLTEFKSRLESTSRWQPASYAGRKTNQSIGYRRTMFLGFWTSGKLDSFFAMWTLAKPG
ncbi:hypothetical protein FJTKL_00231 [Diaporthe vaccinii]|uniref:Uncharacterized protein n=1 Tax=Diaporthe vaccinii TaxID=105482 RepID=A0ABR4E3U5_9PEZI